MKKIVIFIALAIFAGAAVNAVPSKKKPTKPAAAQVDTIAMMIDKANKGDAKAQNTVGIWYYNGKDTLRQDYKKALNYWFLSAKQGNAYAIGNMAMCYQLGRGADKDSLTAVKLYKKALTQGNKSLIPKHEQLVKNHGSLFSSLLLRDCYRDGIGTDVDQKKYAYYLEKAASAGHEASQYELALLLLNSNRADKAASWMKKAAGQGNVGATYYYGLLLFNGQGVAQNKSEGINYLKKASAKGFSMADYQLGRILYDGDGITQDYAKAVEYLKKAASKNRVDAKWLLGKCYLDGTGVDQDYASAAQWLSDAAKSHEDDLKALLKNDKDGIFTQYLKGLKNYYVTKDFGAAIDCFKKVEKAKNVEGTAMKALCLANEGYAKRNDKKAVKILNKIAGKSATADFALSSMLEEGRGTDVDAKRALSLLEQAADKGLASAQCALGDKCMTGDGVVKDMTKAARLYLLAEAQGRLTYLSAQNLAVCYEKKIGILPDLANAAKRIEQLRGYKINDTLVEMLKSIDI